MDCYFRQSWVDKRLAFEGAQDTLALSVSMLARIWKPDTYFYNGKQSYLHTITTPNKFVRIYQNGRVLYSSRLTIKAGCPMNLADFPMDIQKCPLKFGSCEYEGISKECQVACETQRCSIIMHNGCLLRFDVICSSRPGKMSTCWVRRTMNLGWGLGWMPWHWMEWDWIRETVSDKKCEVRYVVNWRGNERKKEMAQGPEIFKWFHASECWERIRWGNGLMGYSNVVWNPYTEWPSWAFPSSFDGETDLTLKCTISDHSPVGR